MVLISAVNLCCVCSYDRIVINKTAIYTFYLPIAAGAS
jgi:hypothetical protein